MGALRYNLRIIARWLECVRKSTRNRAAFDWPIRTKGFLCPWLVDRMLLYLTSRFSNAILEQSIRVDRRYRSGIIAHFSATFPTAISSRRPIVGSYSRPYRIAHSRVSCRISRGVRDRPSVRPSARSFVRSAQFGTVCAASKFADCDLMLGGKKGDWYLVRSREEIPIRHRYARKRLERRLLPPRPRRVT